MKILLGLAVIAASTTAAEYPAQKVNRADYVHFGQSQAEVEALIGKKAVTEESVINRAGIDYSLSTKGVVIDFDTGKLVKVTFEADFKYYGPIAMFPETWRNFDPIGTASIKRGMPKAEFLKYFHAWEERARQAGIVKNNGNKLLTASEYSVRLTNDEFIDMIHIGFGPERSTGKGGSWGSGCSVIFVTAQDAQLTGQKTGTLNSISVLCDEFNTHARKPMVNGQTPAPASGDAARP